VFFAVGVEEAYRHDALAANGLEVQAGLIEFGVGILIVADSAVVALQGCAEGWAETLAAMFDQMEGGARGKSAALAAPAHPGFLSPARRENPAVEISAGDFITLSIDVGDGFDLVIDPGFAAGGLAEAIAEVNHLPGGEAADGGFDVVDLDFEFRHRGLLGLA
jgi:hypothetical protein